LILRADLQEIPESSFEDYQRRLALVETLTDEGIDELTRKEVRQDYCRFYNVSDRTIRNYLKKYREKGAEALLFCRKQEKPMRIEDPMLRKKISDLIHEIPTRTVPRLRRMISQDKELAPIISTISDRTIYRFLAENGLSQQQRYRMLRENGRKSYHQFQAPHSMALVQGDARDGIWLKGIDGKMRKTYLFGWVDDYSRRILSAKYYFDEKLPRMEDSFKDMVLRHGIPEKVYLDNGSVYIARQFAVVLGDLKIKKIHHKPYQAFCKGKVEAVMKTIKRDFQEEAQKAGFQTLEELNSALQAWIDMDYNKRCHSSTGEAPSARFAEGLPESHRRVSDLKKFYNLFLIRETRTITKYGRVKLNSNEYSVRSASHGAVIEVRYDPFDLRRVYYFEDQVLKETLDAAKLNALKVEKIPEETSKPQNQVSAESVAFFERLRERRNKEQKSLDIPAFSQLIEKEMGDMNCRVSSLGGTEGEQK
jgi:putative transposase